MRNLLFKYFRIQTAGLLATWVLLLFMEWGKPHVVGNSFNPQWVLLGLVISAIITAFLAPAGTRTTGLPYRRALAVALGTVGLISIGSAVSSPVGWIAGVVVWGSVLAAVIPQEHYD